MALIYQAQLKPSKIELLTEWVPSQPWWGDADATTLEAVGAYRFDDPDGEVGIETHLLHRADGTVLQVPLTYRGAPLPGESSSLIGTVQHSVLGTRWVYDACGDPVYAATLVATILTGGTQADLEIVTDTGSERRASSTEVWGSGLPDATVPTLTSIVSVSDESKTYITSDEVELVVLRTIGEEEETGATDRPTLLGRWPGHATPSLLAAVSRQGSA